MGITVYKLCARPFLHRSLEERIEIVLEGKPRPQFCKMVAYKGKSITIKEFYDQEPWMTACAIENSIHCWSCLLFLTNMSRSLVASPDVEKLEIAVREHLQLSCHKNSLLQLQCFKKQNSLLEFSDKKNVSAPKNHITNQLKQIIDAVCFLVAQAPHPIRTNGNCKCKVFNLADCVKMLTLLKSYYCEPNITEEAINLIKENPILLDDIVNAIANFLKRRTKNEIQASTYFSVILSEYSEFDTKSKLSTVLRYTSNGIVSERFIGMKNSVEPNNATRIEEHISGLMAEYQLCRDKFLAIACDGAVLSTRELSTFLAPYCRTGNLDVRGRQRSLTCPFSYFVPCHFHDFNNVLEQHLSEISECRLFFNNLKALKSFFQNNPKMCDAFNKATKGVIPDLGNFKLNNSQFLRLLKVYRRQFVDFFRSVVKNFEMWDGDDIAMAIAFQDVLEKYQTVFLLETLFQLFGEVSILSEMLSSHSPENAFNANVLENVILALADQKSKGFENLWTIVITEILSSCRPEALEAAGEDETRHMQDIFTKMVECMSQQIKIRFWRSGRLTILSSLNSETNRKLIVPRSHMKRLETQMQPLTVDVCQLKAELEILSRNGSIFGGKSVHELMAILVRADLQSAFNNAYKLGEFILTMPCKPASLNSTGLSKLDLINVWSNVLNEIEINILGLLFIERDYLEYLRSQNEFYDEVLLELKKISSRYTTMF